MYKSELTGIILTLHLLTTLTCHITSTVIVGLDNQAAIESLNNQKSRLAQYLLDQIHTVAEQLNSKQDHLTCKTKLQQARCNGLHPTIKTRGVCDLRIHWVPGQQGFLPNEKVDELAKKAAKGKSSPRKDLPAFFRKNMPTSIAVLCQENKNKTQWIWKRWWKGSPHGCQIEQIDKSTPSKKWLMLTKPVTHKQALLMLQLWTG